MNENAKQWIAELRSGKWKQGTRNLAKGIVKTPTSPEEFFFCCLGVACELAIKAGVPIKREEFQVVRNGTLEIDVLYDGEQAVLPGKVREWLGLRSENGMLASPVTPEQLNTTTLGITLISLNNVAVMNDYTSLGFKGIADFIETEPVGLFDSNSKGVFRS